MSLPAHFHDEDQVTIVIAGRRRFTFAKRTVALGPGDALLIPAGMPHRSAAEPDGVECVNLYLLASCRRDGLVGLGAAGSRAAACIDRLTARAREDGREPIASLLGDVAQTASRARMSREGFSRAFARGHGMPPQAFSIARRLNHARALLRMGESIAAVAFDSGFADQSHLGRRFRSAFGVTPGQYRAGWTASQTFQT